LPIDNYLISAPPKEQLNPSHMEESIKPLVAPSEENIDPPVVDKFNNKPTRSTMTFIMTIVMMMNRPLKCRKIRLLTPKTKVKTQTKVSVHF